MPHNTLMRAMIPRQLGRYIRYWYTYRTAVAVLIAFILTGAMFGLYTQQLTCDAHQDGCVANVSVHPEDRFAGQYDPGKPVDSVVIVGIDDWSVGALGQYPLPRSDYATALVNLEKAGAQVVGFDVGFTDRSNDDKGFAQALTSSWPTGRRASARRGACRPMDRAPSWSTSPGRPGPSRSTDTTSTFPTLSAANSTQARSRARSCWSAHTA